jgi:ribonuclease BN (tRNA processing enzyme)
MPEVVFLGTGSAFSSQRRGNPAFLIEEGDFRMLVEAGPMIMAQLARVELDAADIQMAFVSHSHGDHTLGFPMLALNRMDAPGPLRVYAGLDTAAALRLLCILAFRGLSLDRFRLRWQELSEETEDRRALGSGVVLRTAVMPHPPGVPTLAARWDFDGGESMTYVTDTYANPSAIELAQGSDMLIHETSYSATLEPELDPAQTYHATAQQAGEIARAAGCRRLALIHLGRPIGDRIDVLTEEAQAGTELEVIIPEDGQRIGV